MAVLSINNVGQSFGDFDVFKGASGSVPNDGKVGLVGPNGIGKTTLLRIIAGHAEASAGSIHLSKGTRIGYLRQEAMQAFAERENTLMEEMLTVFGRLLTQKAQLAELEKKMSANGMSDEIFEQYGKLQMRFEAEGGYEYELRLKQTLTGLGFGSEHYDLPLQVLSGGQKTRALLAKLLLEKPDLLILDEPTNHLDIEAVEWLEGTLKVWDGAILIVSHDRYFLDRVVNRVWEMSRAGIETYRGNYSHYVQQRVERWERRQKEFDAVQGRFLKELDFIKRNIARDSTKNMAVGRLKRLIRQVKMVQVAGTEAITDMQWAQAMNKYGISGAKWEVPDVEQAIKSLPRPSGRPPQLNFNMRSGFRSGKLVLRTNELQIGYPDHALFKAEDIELHRLECAALIGGNGTGKTTFLKTIQDRLEPLQGQIKLGASLKIGYFAQAHDELDHSKTVLDQLIDHSGMLLGEARNHLGRFLFQGDDVFKPISLLSGGERGRLALALLALEKANFLLMDEPTNHLDIPAQESLQAVMANYDGTILMVSHDRYLIDALASQVWEVRDGRLRVYEGGYQAYLAAREEEKRQAKELSAVSGQQSATINQQPATSNQPSLSKNEMRRRERKMEELEELIAAAEEQASTLTVELQDVSTSGDFEAVKRVSAEYEATNQVIATLMEQWEAIAKEIGDL